MSVNEIVTLVYLVAVAILIIPLIILGLVKYYKMIWEWLKDIWKY